MGVDPRTVALLQPWAGREGGPCLGERTRGGLVTFAQPISQSQHFSSTTPEKPRYGRRAKKRQKAKKVRWKKRA